MKAATNPIDFLETTAVPAAAGWRGRLGLTGAFGLGGVDAVVLLLEDHELQLFAMPDTVAVLAAAGIDVVRLPIADGAVPPDADALRNALTMAAAWLREGRSVAVACRAGLGRTGTFAACLCVDAGLDAEAAIALVRRTRPGTIETRGQEDFVRRWAATSGR